MILGCVVKWLFYYYEAGIGLDEATYGYAAVHIYSLEPDWKRYDERADLMTSSSSLSDGQQGFQLCQVSIIPWRIRGVSGAYCQ